MRSVKSFLVTLFSILALVSQAQVEPQKTEEASIIELNYLNPEEYKIEGISFSGNAECDVRMLYFAVGDKIKIPGEKIRKTIERLSKSGLYKDNIRISATQVIGRTIFLDIYLEEAPRLSNFIFKGVKKGDIEEFNKKLNLSQGKIVNDNLTTIINNVVVDYYKDKGFYFARVDIKKHIDSLNPSYVILTIDVSKGKKVKINHIHIRGAKEVDVTKLRMAMKETKTKFLFQPFEQIDTAIVDFFKNHDKYKGKDLGELFLAYHADRVRVRFKRSKFDQQAFEND
jgi:outer membrane protein assembly factor BamA